MPDDKNKEIIQKMWQAYEEFARYIFELEKQGDELMKSAIKQLDKEKIDSVLKQIKEM